MNRNRRGATLTSPRRTRRIDDQHPTPLAAVKHRLTQTVRWVFLIMVGVSVFAVGAVAMEKLVPMVDRPVQRVVIEGDFAQVDQALLHEKVAARLNTTLLRLNLESLRDDLEGEPWISQAQIKRQWPDQLWIRVVEERPIARWGADAFVNQRGELIEAPLRVDVGDLPTLIGSDGVSNQVTEQYLLLNRALRNIGVRIEQLERSATGYWKIDLDNDVELLLGRGDLLGKTRRINAVWQAMLEEQISNIERIDARYDNGVAIGWKNQTELNQGAPERET